MPAKNATTPQKLGRISHYFPKIGVAVVDVSFPMHVGDSIVIKGASTQLKQRIDSMQIEHASVQEAKAGQSVGMKVSAAVKEGDEVFRA